MLPLQAVIIGGGVAGATCALELSALTPPHLSLTVTLIDPQPVIKACTLVAKLTRSAVDLSISDVDASEWCRHHGINFVQDRVVKLRPGIVHCQSGAVFQFSACCLATGATPFVPLPIAAGGDRVLTLRDTHSVHRLQNILAGARRVAVVGAGGIAMELVHEITDCQIVWLVKGTHAGTAFFDKRAMDTLSDLFGLTELSCGRVEDVVKSEARRTGGRGKLGNGLDEPSINRVAQNSDEKHTQSYGGGVGPEWVRRRFEPILLDEKGTVETQPRSKYTELKGGISGSQESVTIALESEILRVERDDAGEWPVVAHLSDGSNLGTDIILVGTGVLPNVDWLTGSGIELDQGVAYNSQQYFNNCRGGILVSAENMSTNVRGIFAAGDCTTVRPETVGTNWMQMRLWSQAQTAGRACAQSMAAFLKGETAACSGLDFDVFAHATQFFSKKVVLLGRYNAQGLKDNYKMVESGGGKEGNHYIRVVLENGRVRGAILVGEVDKAETFENLILDGLDVSWLEEELVDPSVDIEDYFD